MGGFKLFPENKREIIRFTEPARIEAKAEELPRERMIYKLEDKKKLNAVDVRCLMFHSMLSTAI